MSEPDYKKLLWECYEHLLVLDKVYVETMAQNNTSQRGPLGKHTQELLERVTEALEAQS